MTTSVANENFMMQLTIVEVLICGGMLLGLDLMLPRLSRRGLLILLRIR